MDTFTARTRPLFAAGAQAPAETLVRPNAYALDEPLPHRVLTAGTLRLSRYQQFPVFGWPWFRMRSALFVSVFALGAVFVAALIASLGYGLQLVAALTLYSLKPCLVSVTGPLLATMVRQQCWPQKKERLFLVLAVALGVAVAFLADWWAAEYVNPSVDFSGRFIPDFAPTCAFNRLAGGVKVFFVLVVYFVLGGGLALWAYFVEVDRWAEHVHTEEVAAIRAQQQHSELRLSILQAQVEPHFLFNSLASVRALITRKPERAESALDALVDYLRATIPRLRAEEGGVSSTLGQQLDLCESFLKLMHVRMGERLHYSIAVDPSLRNVRFMPLLLISLVENAVKHGIEPKLGRGRIAIAAQLKNNQLIVSVHDDGVGLRVGFVGGLGLTNVRDRLVTHYGAAAQLQLESSFGDGTLAEIRVPVETSL
jgi:two-component sensor histidine kinase